MGVHRYRAIVVATTRAPRLLAALLVAVTLVAAACAADETSLAGIVRDPALQVGEVVLPAVDQEGNETDLAFHAESDELLVAFFGYTHCPDVCPTTMADLRTALGRLGDDAARVEVAFVTTDPDRDTPEVLVGYVEGFIPDARSVRTEDPDELQRAEEPFVAQSAVTEHDHGDTEVEHSAAVYVIDDAGTVLVEWPVGTSNTAMSDDLRVLLDRVASGGDGA